MTAVEGSHVQMAQIHLNERISLIFNENAQSRSLSSRSRSGSSDGKSHSSGSRRHLKRHEARGRRRRSSSSSSSSSRSSQANSSPRSRHRSRSHPRCHRAASNSRCCLKHRQAYGQRRHRSPPGRYRANSRSYSPSPDRSHRINYRAPSKSASQRSRLGSSSRNHRNDRSRSRSRSSERSVSHLRTDEKRRLFRTAEANAIRALGVEQLDLPRSVKPILGESREAPVGTRLSISEPKPEERVRPGAVPQRSVTQQNAYIESDEDTPSPRVSPKRRIISFSIHNSVAKPAAIAASGTSKVIPRVESFTIYREPFGQWVPARKTVKSTFHHTSFKH